MTINLNTQAVQQVEMSTDPDYSWGTENVLQRLRERLVKANDTLSQASRDEWFQQGWTPTGERLRAKAEGVRLALSYVEEELR